MTDNDTQQHNEDAQLEEAPVEQLELSDQPKVKNTETITVAVKHEDGEKIKEEILEIDLKRENGLYEDTPDSIDSSEMVDTLELSNQCMNKSSL